MSCFGRTTERRFGWPSPSDVSSPSAPSATPHTAVSDSSSESTSLLSRRRHSDRRPFLRPLSPMNPPREPSSSPNRRGYDEENVDHNLPLSLERPSQWRKGVSSIDSSARPLPTSSASNTSDSPRQEKRAARSSLQNRDPSPFDSATRLSSSASLNVDAVTDPEVKDSLQSLLLAAFPAPPRRQRKKHPFSSLSAVLSEKLVEDTAGSPDNTCRSTSLPLLAPDNDTKNVIDEITLEDERKRTRYSYPIPTHRFRFVPLAQSQQNATNSSFSCASEHLSEDTLSNASSQPSSSSELSPSLSAPSRSLDARTQLDIQTNHSQRLLIELVQERDHLAVQLLLEQEKCHTAEAEKDAAQVTMSQLQAQISSLMAATQTQTANQEELESLKQRLSSLALERDILSGLNSQQMLAIHKHEQERAEFEKTYSSLRLEEAIVSEQLQDAQQRMEAMKMEVLSKETSKVVLSDLLSASNSRREIQQQELDNAAIRLKQVVYERDTALSTIKTLSDELDRYRQSIVDMESQTKHTEIVSVKLAHKKRDLYWEKAQAVYQTKMELLALRESMCIQLSLLRSLRKRNAEQQQMLNELESKYAALAALLAEHDKAIADLYLKSEARSYHLCDSCGVAHVTSRLNGTTGSAEMHSNQIDMNSTAAWQTKYQKLASEMEQMKLEQESWTAERAKMIESHVVSSVPTRDASLLFTPPPISERPLRLHNTPASTISSRFPPSLEEIESWAPAEVINESALCSASVLL